MGMAEVGDRGDLPRIDSLVGEHDPVDAAPVVSRLDRLHVEVVEQSELAAQRMGESSPADDHRPLPGG